MKKLCFEIRDPFHQLLVGMYLTKRLIDKKAYVDGNLFFDHEITNVCENFLPKVVVREIDTQVDLECGINADLFAYLSISLDETGKVFISSAKTPKDSDDGFHNLEIGQGNLGRAFTLIEDLLKHAKSVVQIKLNDSYTAIVEEGSDMVQVGCQKIPVSAIKELYGAIIKSAYVI